MKELCRKTNLREPVDVDRIDIKRDHYFSNAYLIDLPLDSTPDHVWQDIFEQEWKSSRHLWERKLFIVGDQLRLITPPSDIEDKVDWIKQIVERTNQKIDTYNQEAEARKAHKEEELKRHPSVEEEKASTDMIKDILRRKFTAA